MLLKVYLDKFSIGVNMIIKVFIVSNVPESTISNKITFYVVTQEQADKLAKELGSDNVEIDECYVARIGNSWYHLEDPNPIDLDLEVDEATIILKTQALEKLSESEKKALGWLE